MTLQFRFLLIAASLIFFAIVLAGIRKSKMALNMASIWVVWSLGIVLIALLPEIVTIISDVLGIYSPINTLFFVMLFILYCFAFYLCVKVSILEECVKKLVQYIGQSEYQERKRSDL